MDWWMVTNLKCATQASKSSYWQRRAFLSHNPQWSDLPLDRWYLPMAALPVVYTVKSSATSITRQSFASKPPHQGIQKCGLSSYCKSPDTCKTSKETIMKEIRGCLLSDVIILKWAASSWNDLKYRSSAVLLLKRCERHPRTKEWCSSAFLISKRCGMDWVRVLTLSRTLLSRVKTLLRRALIHLLSGSCVTFHCRVMKSNIAQTEVASTVSHVHRICSNIVLLMSGYLWTLWQRRFFETSIQTEMKYANIL